MRQALVVALALTLAATPLEAQDGGGRLPRKWLVAGIGALVASAFATVYALSFEGDIGGCSGGACVVPASALGGAVIGFMIGSELDKLYAIRYRHAPPVTLRGRALPLAVMPTDLAVRQRNVLVTGAEGLEVIRTGPALDRVGLRARGLRGIGPVTSDSAANVLLVGTPVGLYRFPLRGDDLGTLAFPGEISALATEEDHVALGLGPDLQLAQLADSLRPVADAIPEEARIVDLAWQNADRLWVLTEDRLVAYTADGAGTLTPRGAFPLPALGRRLALQDSMAYVATGSGGVYAVDVRDPATLVERGNWSGARFAYDVAVIDSTVYVAAGPEGLYLLRPGPDGFRAIGLSRSLGFVAAVASDGEALYVLDRSGVQLRRIPRAGTR